MRFLLDNNLSPRLAGFLRAGGHEVVHVRDIGMASATDPVVIDAARVQGRVLISADTDFGTPVRPHARHHALVPAPPASKWTTRIRAGGDHPEQPLRRPSRSGRGRHRGSRRRDATHPQASYRSA
jgi:hypothetical protein